MIDTKKVDYHHCICSSVKCETLHLMETDSKENNQHFSEILFLDDDFQCIGKISMFGDTEVFFKTLCTLSNEILETDFDGFCQELYSIFAEQFDKIIAVTETKWGMHRRVLELLQSKKYSKLVAKLQEQRLKCHHGLGAVVLTLHWHFLDQVRQI